MLGAGVTQKGTAPSIVCTAMLNTPCGRKVNEDKTAPVMEAKLETHREGKE